MCLEFFHFLFHSLFINDIFYAYLFQFAGVIGEVASDIDITNRTDVLRIIDKGKVRHLDIDIDIDVKCMYQPQLSLTVTLS